MKHVRDLGGLFDMRRLVNVREDRDADLRLHGGEDVEAAFDADAAIGADRGTVGLVVAGLEDVRDPELVGDLLETPGDLQGMRRRLDDAGPRDQEKRSVPDPERADPDRFVSPTFHALTLSADAVEATVPCWRAYDAATNPENRGCGCQGRDLNSG